MMRVPRLLSLALALSLLCLPACASRGADFTILSTKNVELSRVDLQNMEFSRNIEASDSRFWFLFIPFGAAPDMEEAVDHCLEQGGGDFMTSAVVYESAWSVILFSYSDIRIKGDVGNSITGRPIVGAGTNSSGQ
jgi:hypothetical protein